MTSTYPRLLFVTWLGLAAAFAIAAPMFGYALVAAPLLAAIPLAIPASVLALMHIALSALRAARLFSDGPAPNVVPELPRPARA